MSAETSKSETLPTDHANVHVSQSLFTDHMWQEISKASPRRWGRPDVDLFVKEIFRQMARALSNGYVLEILNFGVFRVVSTNEVRHGMPGRPGEVHTFPPRCVVAFRPSKALKKSVLKLPAAKFPRGKTRAERPVPRTRRKTGDPT